MIKSCQILTLGAMMHDTSIRISSNESLSVCLSRSRVMFANVNGAVTQAVRTIDVDADVHSTEANLQSKLCTLKAE